MSTQYELFRERLTGRLAMTASAWISNGNDDRDSAEARRIAARR